MKKYKIQELENMEDLGALMEGKDWIVYDGTPMLFLGRKLGGIEVVNERYSRYEKLFSLERDLTIKDNGIVSIMSAIRSSLTKEEYVELTR